MRKTKHRKYGFLLDSGILLHGYKDKYGFHPDKDIQCGFSYEIVRRRNINKTVFYSLIKAKSALGNIEVAGNNVVALFAIDAGMAVTKIKYKIDDISGFYKTKTLITDKGNEENINLVIKECLDYLGISLDTTFKKEVIDTANATKFMCQ